MYIKMVPSTGDYQVQLRLGLQFVDLQTLLLANWEKNAIRQTPCTLVTKTREHAQWMLLYIQSVLDVTHSSYPTHSCLWLL